MTLNGIWLWSSGSKDHLNEEYPFIAITASSLWAVVVVTVRVSSIAQIDALKLFLFDKNT